jgi:arabinofuranosyltransferase
VKEATGSVWARGFTYLSDLISPYHLWIALEILLLVGLYAARHLPRDTKLLAVVFAPVAAGLLLVAYVIKLGGDFMHGRMLLPGLFMVLLPMLVLPIRRLLVPVVVFLATWTVVCGASWRVWYVRGVDNATGIADERGFWINDLRTQYLTSQQPYVRNFPFFPAAVRQAIAGKKHVMVSGPVTDLYTLPLSDGVHADYVIVFGNLGTNGATTPLTDIAVDPDGIAYPLAAHVEVTQKGRVGHEKYLSDIWTVALYAAPGALPAGMDPAAVSAARHALTCGPMKDLVDSAYMPMSWSRFWDNLTGAVGRTTFRFPQDPFAAEREFCHSTTTGH